jgi:hypothetical protein
MKILFNSCFRFFFKCFGHEINVETFIKILFNSCFGIFLGISFGHKINDVETLFIEGGRGHKRHY